MDRTDAVRKDKDDRVNKDRFARAAAIAVS